MECSRTFITRATAEGVAIFVRSLAVFTIIMFTRYHLIAFGVGVFLHGLIQFLLSERYVWLSDNNPFSVGQSLRLMSSYLGQCAGKYVLSESEKYILINTVPLEGQGVFAFVTNAGKSRD